MMACPRRPATCAVCAGQVPLDAMLMHKDSCPCTPVPCTACGVTLLRREVTQ
jgi:hypothetical protein